MSTFKEDVKDELFKMDQPETLDEYIKMAVRIGNRLYGGVSRNVKGSLAQPDQRWRTRPPIRSRRQS